MIEIDSLVNIKYIPLKQIHYMNLEHATIYFYKPDELTLFEFFLYNSNEKRIFKFDYIRREGGLIAMSYDSYAKCDEYIEKYFSEVLMESIL